MLIFIINNSNFDEHFQIRIKSEILTMEKYFKICNNEILLKNIKKFKKEQNPQISIISSVYNKQEYLLRFLRSIQNQFNDKIEIILIDDFSEDKSVNFIEAFQKIDKRIILLKHNNNKGTLISRNEGIFLSKGKYILFPDSDDILSNNILNQCLTITKEKNYDMIRFHTYMGKNHLYMHNKIKILANKSINQPELSSYIFYGLGYLRIIDPMISNKFIKRNILIDSLNLINGYFLIQNMIFYEDTLINYMIYKLSKSYYYINNIGYYYISNCNSSTMSFNKNRKKLSKFKNSFFLFLKFIFEYTKNNKYEKDIGNEIIEKEKEILKFLNDNDINSNINLFKNIINLYLKNKFINISTKNKLIKIKDGINNN